MMQRLKKILKWIGIVLGGLVVLGLILNAGFIWITNTRLERQLAAIRATGDPLTPTDLARPPIPPEQDAATYLNQTLSDCYAIDKNWDRYWKWRGERSAEDPMPPEIQKLLEDTFSIHPNLIPLLDQASHCPDYDAKIDFTAFDNQKEFFEKTLLPCLQQPRSLARILEARSYLLVAKGKYNEAVQNDLILLRLTRLWDHNPFIASYLTTITIRGMALYSIHEALQAGPISNDVRNALDAELALQEPMAGFAQILKSERVFVVGSYMNTLPGRNFWLVSRGRWNIQEADCLSMFPSLIVLANDPDAYRKAISALEGQGSILADLLKPALNAAFAAMTRVRAEIRCLRVLNAIQARGLEGSEKAPKLSELGLPPETTTDPFNGQPLHVKKLPEGWLIYSVGSNLEDDGGTVLDDPVKGDTGVGPHRPKK
jgi:hypothetical protein